jgi:hypothetical protein
LKIGASTPFDFSARNLTAYGGLLPVATMLETLGSAAVSRNYKVQEFQVTVKIGFKIER